MRYVIEIETQADVATVTEAVASLQELCPGKLLELRYRNLPADSGSIVADWCETAELVNEFIQRTKGAT